MDFVRRGGRLRCLVASLLMVAGCSTFGSDATSADVDGGPNDASAADVQPDAAADLDAEVTDGGVLDAKGGDPEDPCARIAFDTPVAVEGLPVGTTSARFSVSELEVDYVLQKKAYHAVKLSSGEFAGGDPIDIVQVSDVGSVHRSSSGNEIYFESGFGVFRRSRGDDGRYYPSSQVQVQGVLGSGYFLGHPYLVETRAQLFTAALTLDGSKTSTTLRTSTVSASAVPGSAELVTVTPEAFYAFPVGTSDGHCLYAARAARGVAELVVVGANGTATTVGGLFGAGIWYYPTWVSPDGRRLYLIGGVNAADASMARVYVATRK